MSLVRVRGSAQQLAGREASCGARPGRLCDCGRARPEELSMTVLPCCATLWSHSRALFHSCCQKSVSSQAKAWGEHSKTPKFLAVPPPPAAARNVSGRGGHGGGPVTKRGSRATGTEEDILEDADGGDGWIETGRVVHILPRSMSRAAWHAQSYAQSPCRVSVMSDIRVACSCPHPP